MNMDLARTASAPGTLEGIRMEHRADPGASVTPRDFKNGMRRLASGVSIISTVHEGTFHGLAATAVTSVSADPPTLLVCVNRSASSHDPLVDSRRFCVNVLAEEDHDIATRFGSSLDRASRFQSREWTKLTTGAPALIGSLACFDCTVVDIIAASTHTLLFGQVVDLRTWADEVKPLLFWDGRYHLRSDQRGRG